VHPREVVRRTLELNAAALVLCAQPSFGRRRASQADELITRRLADALALIDVRVLDHMVVAGGAVTNFVRRGLI
jgi:DNA repair protein RadC